MEEEKIDEKILELTDIFNELTSNAIGLSKDLVTGIDAIRLVSYFWFVAAFLMYLFGNSYGWNYNFILILVGFIGIGIINLRRFRNLKSKYSEIYQLREKLETMKG